MEQFIKHFRRQSGGVWVCVEPATLDLPQGRVQVTPGTCLTIGTKFMNVDLARMLDESEFFGPHGIRALSRYHLDHPYVFSHEGQEHRVAYVPGDSDTGMFGGNSNWRGPVWMPINFLLYTALLRLYAYYGDGFKIECPTGSGQLMTLMDVSHELGERLSRTFLRDASGRRPVNGRAQKFNDDPHWQDLVLFHEYFHGDTGAGIGASHQTGWTGCIARIVQTNAILNADLLLTPGVEAAALRILRTGGRS